MSQMINSAAINFVNTLTERKFKPKQGMGQERETEFKSDAIRHVISTLKGIDFDTASDVLRTATDDLVMKSRYGTWPEISEIISAVSGAIHKRRAQERSEGEGARDPRTVSDDYKDWISKFIRRGRNPRAVSNQWFDELAQELLRTGRVGARDLEKALQPTNRERRAIGIPEKPHDPENLRVIGEILAGMERKQKEARQVSGAQDFFNARMEAIQSLRDVAKRDAQIAERIKQREEADERLRDAVGSGDVEAAQAALEDRSFAQDALRQLEGEE